MGRSIAKVILIIICLILFVVIGFASYFYFALSGNPLTRLTEKQTCLAYYEKTYGIHFSVYQSSYDYKRHTSEFKIGPTDRPEITFFTSAHELEREDGYGPSLASYYLEEAAKRILEQQYSQLTMTINAYEESDPLNKTETDPQNRLAQNNYSLFVSWEDDLISRADADSIVAVMAKSLTSQLADTTKKLDLHVMVIRKTSDYFSYFLPIK